MATIFTVHGTFATGPEHGDEWWQIGGVVDRELRSYVAADDGEIDLEPVIWDGDNSELSRRNAATKLLSKTKEEDERGKRYVLIGHSHGGAVIHNAALQSASRGLFPKLACIVTVATPFIIFRKSPFLFSRVGIFGKATLLILFFYAYSAILFVGHQVSFDNWRFSFGPISAAKVAFSILSLIAIYVAVRVFSAPQFRRYSRHVRKLCQARLNANWHFLYDRNDEAVRGLGSVHSVTPRIFPKRFAVSFLSLLAAFVVPIVILITTPTRGGAIHVFLSSYFGALQTLIFLPFSFLTSNPNWSGFIVTSVIFGFLVLTFLFTALATICAIGISKLLAPIFDIVTWSAIKKSFFGADTIGESADIARDHPEWMEVGFNPLPIDLSRQINDFSDEAAAKSIPRLRNAIEDLIKLCCLADPNKSVAEYLTWSELVHTSYFAIPRFRKLVYYIIANSEAFKPTEAFLNDPDYRLVEQWYQEIQPSSK